MNTDLKPEKVASGAATIIHGDNREVLQRFADNTFHAIVTDPPYHLTTGKKGGSGPASENLKSPAGRARISTGFMGKAWDGGDIAFNVEMWRECLRVLRPGGYLLSFGGTRTYHRMACAIEDAGFEIRDMIEWLYGSGFPKSLDVSKAMDKKAGAKRKVVGISKNGSGAHQTKMANHGPGDTGIGYMDGSGKVFNITQPSTLNAQLWSGYGTALKPAHEPICVARKALDGTVVENVLKWGCGAVNIDGCRVNYSTDDRLLKGGTYGGNRKSGEGTSMFGNGGKSIEYGDLPGGRFPANLILDSEAAAMLDAQSGDNCGAAAPVRKGHSGVSNGIYRDFASKGDDGATFRNDTGGASRFFYTAKASGTDRGNKVKGALPLFDVAEEEFRNTHPTVKPLALMRYLLKLVCPQIAGGAATHVLDPFLGSGTTAVAARELGFDCTGIELEVEHMPIIHERLGLKETV